MKFKDVSSQYCRITEKDWEVLTECTKNIDTYVEVGTFHGASACCAAQGSKQVYTIDIYDWQPKLWKSKSFKNKINFFKGTSVDFTEFLFSKFMKGNKLNFIIDTLFIDGAHEEEGVLMDCRNLIPLVKTGGSILFHDHNPHNPYTGVFSTVNNFLLNIPHKKFNKVEGTSNLFRIEKL